MGGSLLQKGKAEEKRMEIRSALFVIQKEITTTFIAEENLPWISHISCFE